MMGFRKLNRFVIALISLLYTLASFAADTRLEQAFRHPPAAAKPWVYWFWINGNISKEGITADLEAMARVGIGGVLIMEVAKPRTMAPDGPVAFASPPWRGMFKHVVAECKRLGLEVNMNNDAGWCGSGGPWVTPELSMQKIVSRSMSVHGGGRVEQVLPHPETLHNYYRDIKVLAFPKIDKDTFVSKASIVDLTDKMKPDGKLVWNAPGGEWQVIRIGCTTTGRVNKPAPKSGEGLECDKFNPLAIEQHFKALIGKLADDVGRDAGKVFTTTHIDSWEVGTQDWTPRMAEEFRKRCGYDLQPWLVVLAGGPAVGSADETARFRWDFKRTQSELNDEAYAGALRRLAHERGLKLSIEAYNNGGFLNPLTYGAEADLPMSEFWITRWNAWHLLSSRLMASVAHVYNKPVIGAESFTSHAQNDAFTEHPYSVKSIGDWAFSEGINQFVFHRSVLHPWTNCVPGMGFSGYGWHADRNQTWWESGAAYMTYLSRCQSMLRQGQFVADVCRLVPDGENYGQSPGMATLPSHYEAIPTGYNYDYISDRAVLEELTVKNGRMIARNGMSYRLLQLPDYKALTPELTRKLRDLVQAGAVVIGPRPDRSPSLQNFPRGDQEVVALSAELWGNCDAQKVTEHKFGSGRVNWGRPIADVLREVSRAADFAFVVDPKPTAESLMPVTQGPDFPRTGEAIGSMPTAGLNWIHRRTSDAEIYFVANPQYREVNALCTFRVTGLGPELWDPATGETRTLAVYNTVSDGVQVPIHFGSAESFFVVFREKAKPSTQVVEVRRDGVLLFGVARQTPALLPELRGDVSPMTLATREPGHYQLRYANGLSKNFEIAEPANSSEVSGPWSVRFQAGRGAPEQAEFPQLADWSKHTEQGIRFFSGTAAYVTHFDWNSPHGQQRWKIDLGEVMIMAEVKLNGRNLGVLWKPPYAIDVTDVLKPGRNKLEVKVSNLWPNRLIGDEQYPDDCTRDGSWTKGPIPAWPEWLRKGESRPEPRRVTFTTWKYYTKDSPLLSSGLLGPVRILPVQIAKAKP